MRLMLDLSGLCNNCILNLTVADRPAKEKRLPRRLRSDRNGCPHQIVRSRRRGKGNLRRMQAIPARRGILTSLDGS